MKSVRKVVVFCLVLGALCPVLTAQSLKGMTFGAATGLYTVPTGRIGWERTSDFGLDFGYHAIISNKGSSYNGKLNHIGQLSASLFKFAEISAAFDYQPPFNAVPDAAKPNSDFILGAKIQLPTNRVAVALGGNFQAINLSNRAGYNALGIYTAATYGGDFFGMPAETTLALGKTFFPGGNRGQGNSSDIDFGMGFDLVIFPVETNRLIHWLIDFSNFSYSVDAWGSSAWYRGTVNTGIRLDLASIEALSKFKFVIDATLVDFFDKERAFSFGLTFGAPIL